MSEFIVWDRHVVDECDEFLHDCTSSLHTALHFPHSRILSFLFSFAGALLPNFSPYFRLLSDIPAVVMELTLSSCLAFAPHRNPSNPPNNPTHVTSLASILSVPSVHLPHSLTPRSSPWALSTPLQIPMDNNRPRILVEIPKPILPTRSDCRHTRSICGS